MARDEQLKALFRAFADGGEQAFLRAAHAIISAELAANHHGLATELQKALRPQGATPRARGARNGLRSLPKDRRNGEILLALQESSVSEDRIVLEDTTKAKIGRLLDEHRKATQLRRSGYGPKTKLLFWGPPGCGKTFAAFHVAHELGLPVGVLRLNAAISSFLGDTASHLQRVFDMASSTPMVLLLDEADAVAKNRDDPNDVGELKRIVNSLLQAMDAFHTEHSVVIAASNHQYLLDPAVWRRFEDIIHFPMPGMEQRKTYLALLLSGINFEGSVPSVAKRLSSLSYADIERVTIEAVKGMILGGRDVLRSADIMTQYRTMRTSRADAQGHIRVTKPRRRRQ